MKVAAAIAQIMQDMKDKPEGKLPELKSSARKPSESKDESEETPESGDEPSTATLHLSLPKAKAMTRKNEKMMHQKRKILGIPICLIR